MQIVIDITDETYLRIVRPDKLTTDGDINSVMWAVYNGMPLPKGHGRLIDADALLKDRHKAIPVIHVIEAPTVLEADKESEE